MLESKVQLELDLSWVPNFIALAISFLGPNFPGMRGLILVLMSDVCYLAVILIFLVIAAHYLVVTAGYCSLRGGYWWLLLVAARYLSFPILVCMGSLIYFRDYRKRSVRWKRLKIFLAYICAECWYLYLFPNRVCFLIVNLHRFFQCTEEL